jgi:hypothetical protein
VSILLKSSNLSEENRMFPSANRLVFLYNYWWHITLKQISDFYFRFLTFFLFMVYFKSKEGNNERLNWQAFHVTMYFPYRELHKRKRLNIRKNAAGWQGLKHLHNFFFVQEFNTFYRINSRKGIYIYFCYYLNHFYGSKDVF